MPRANTDQPNRSIGTDFLQLDIAQAPAGGMAEWLSGQLRAAIADGRLGVGTRLPASRVLATDLRVSRGVVTEAYQRLTEDGHLAGRGRAGTAVVAAPVTAPRSARAQRTSLGSARPTAVRSRPTGMFTTSPAVDIFDVLRAAEASIDLSPGVPDLMGFPRTAWLRAERFVLKELSAGSFGYGDPRGAPALRLAIADWLALNRGILADPRDVVVVAGVAQAIGIVAQVLRGEGVRAIAVEDPGSLGARQHLQNWQFETPPIAVDGFGLAVGELRDSGAQAVLLTPAHQFPTGVVLEGGRRRELIQWAADGGIIIEDDYDAEHRYDRPPVPAIRSMLVEQVFYAGSVSKWLAPALRIGWMLAPPRRLEAVVATKRNADLGNAVLPQLVLAELMRSGEMERHLRFTRKRHRARRDAMLDAVQTQLPWATVHGAAAGLHLMVTFNASFSDLDLAEATLSRGVKVQPLSWHCQRPYRPGLVLGYGATAPGEIHQGIATIARALRSLG